MYSIVLYLSGEHRVYNSTAPCQTREQGNDMQNTYGLFMALVSSYDCSLQLLRIGIKQTTQNHEMLDTAQRLGLGCCQQSCALHCRASPTPQSESTSFPVYNFGSCDHIVSSKMFKADKIRHRCLICSDMFRLFSKVSDIRAWLISPPCMRTFSRSNGLASKEPMAPGELKSDRFPKNETVQHKKQKAVESCGTRYGTT